MNTVAAPRMMERRGSISARKKLGSNSFICCVGCGGQIHDQFILRVAPNLEWHAACLKCCECQMFLDENHTCFVREGKTYCKKDYVRLFGAKCDKCLRPFDKNEFVMRAKNKIFHTECFRCNACEKQLLPGEEFALKYDGSIFCKDDHKGSAVGAGGNNDHSSSPMMRSPREENNNKDDDLDSRFDSKSAEDEEDGDEDGFKTDDGFDESKMSDGGSSSLLARGPDSRPASSADLVSPGGAVYTAQSGKQSRGAGGQNQNQRRNRAGRVRTVLTEKQLNVLKSCYHANPRPDALMKEQLTEMTGLSSRVIRVWFQNKRCKDKKKQIARQDRKMDYSGMSGIPLIAREPTGAGAAVVMQGGLPMDAAQADIHAYEAPWKALCDFALHSDLDKINMASNPHYGQLVSQMHGGCPYDGSYPPGCPPPPPGPPCPPVPVGGPLDGCPQMPPDAPPDGGMMSPPHQDPEDEYLMFNPDAESSAAAAPPPPPPPPPMDPAMAAAAAAAAAARYTITNLDASSGGGSSDGANSS